jgi:hypothetical protein
LKSSILPLESVEPELLEAFLTAPGIGRGYSAAEVRWKYLDEEFSQGRERGYASVKDGRVRGFVGMIPVKVSMPDSGDRDLIWTCDWAVDEPEKNPGIGILLLTKVHRTYGLVAGVGGTDFTRAIVPRMNTHIVPNATTVLRRPLRLRPLLERAEKAVSRLPNLSGTALSRLAVPLRRQPTGANPTFAEGVSAAVAALFDQPAQGRATVRYDLRHLAWLARSPSMEVRSCHLGRDDFAAGAILWRRQHHPTRWRLVLRAGPEGELLLEPLLASLLRHMRDDLDASLASVAVSSEDRALLTLLKRHGFLSGERHDLYINKGEGFSGCEDGFAPMTYLDTDLGIVPWAEELT